VLALQATAAILNAPTAFLPTCHTVDVVHNRLLVHDRLDQMYNWEENVPKKWSSRCDALVHVQVFVDDDITALASETFSVA